MASFSFLMSLLHACHKVASTRAGANLNKTWSKSHYCFISPLVNQNTPPHVHFWWGEARLQWTFGTAFKPLAHWRQKAALCFWQCNAHYAKYYILLSTIHSPHLQSFFINAQQPFPTNGLEKIDTDSHSNDKMHLLIAFKGGKKLFIELWYESAEKKCNH